MAETQTPDELAAEIKRLSHEDFRAGTDASKSALHAAIERMAEALRISQSEREVWRYLPELNEELAACRRRIAELEAEDTSYMEALDMRDKLDEEQVLHIAELEAKVDALMLEYCPDEMTPEQVENWGKHQRPASAAVHAETDAHQRVSDDTIREVFIRNGFTIKPGETDLKPYVYAAGRELIAVAQRNNDLALRAAPVAEAALTDEEIRRIHYHAACLPDMVGLKDQWPEIVRFARAIQRAAMSAANPLRSWKRDPMKPETGTSDDLAEAADLVGRVSSAKTNGEALAVILSYRKRVRSEALTATPAPVAEVLTWPDAARVLVAEVGMALKTAKRVMHLEVGISIPEVDRAIDAIAAAMSAAPPAPEPNARDVAGNPKPQASLIEREAVRLLNAVKAWRDCDGNDPFPNDVRMGIDALLMMAEMRRTGLAAPPAGLGGA